MPKEGIMSMRLTHRMSLSFRKICAKIVFFSMFCFAIVFLAQSSRAEDCNPIQISLLPSVQLIPKENAICGARLNLLWGENTSVRGIDAGLVNVAESIKGIEIGGLNWLSGHNRNESWGIQIAGINYMGNSSFIGGQLGFVNVGSLEASASITDIQAAAFNLNEGEINGLQFGGANLGWNVNGLQLGSSNFGGNVNGLQIAVLGNVAEINLNGVQIGLLVNGAENVHGIQIGLLNMCDSLSGVQIGLINIVTSRFPDKGLFVSPFINVGF